MYSVSMVGFAIIYREGGQYCGVGPGAGGSRVKHLPKIMVITQPHDLWGAAKANSFNFNYTDKG